MDTQLTPDPWQVREPLESNDPTEHEVGQAALSTSGWLLVGASLRGKQHAHEGRYREDAFALAYCNGWNIASVADGAGSAALARVGARIATTVCVVSLRRAIEGFKDGDVFTAEGSGHLRNALESAIIEARDELMREAANRKRDLRELRTTLLVAVHRANGAGNFVLAAQIGDGLIAGWSPSLGTVILTTPKYGEFANETEFLTDMKPSDVAARVSEGASLSSDLRYLTLLTDGVADDFLPAKKQLPRLFEQFPGILRRGEAAAAQELLGLISYTKRASFDDRTAVLIGSSNDESVVG